MCFHRYLKRAHAWFLKDISIVIFGRKLVSEYFCYQFFLQVPVVVGYCAGCGIFGHPVIPILFIILQALLA